jgi:hypothetical protein
VVKLKKFIKFVNTVEALAAAAALVDSKLDKSTRLTPCLQGRNGLDSRAATRGSTVAG